MRSYVASKLGYFGKVNKGTEGVVVWDPAESKIERATSKEVKGAICSWPYFDISDAVKTADVVFKGKVLSKSPITKGLPIYKRDGSISDYDYYHEVTVEILENIKGCENQDTIIYKEPGGETEDFIYIMNGVEPLDVEGEYIFFLYDNNTFLNPSTVIAVSDGMVKPSSELVSEVFGNTRLYNGISVDAYIEAIRSELE